MSIREDTSAYVSGADQMLADLLVSIAAHVRIREDTSAYVSIREDT